MVTSDIINITNPFLGKGWQSQPYQMEGKIFATDGHTAILMDSGDWQGSSLADQSKEQQIKELMNDISGNPVIVSIEEFKRAISIVPLRAETWENTCKACVGSGTVDWEFTHETELYYDEFDCPVCKGVGYTWKGKTGNLILCEEHRISIGVCRFNPKYIKRAIDVAEEFKVDSISVYKPFTSHSGIYLGIGDATVLIMPINPEEDSIIAFHINL